MKTAHVVVRWSQGLHLRPAAQLVQVANGFRAQIHLKFESIVADARSALSILMLGAASGASLELHVAGEDEHDALEALQNFFAASQNESSDDATGAPLRQDAFAA